MGELSLGPTPAGSDQAGQDASASATNASEPSAAVLARMIEGDIIPRLLLAHQKSWTKPAAFAEPVEPIDQDRIEAFARLALRHDVGVLLAHVGSIMDQGAGLDEIYLDLLAPVARRLGAMWEEDLCAFTDVTVGLCRLQQLVYELSSQTPRAAEQVTAARRAMFASAPGEQHTFGLVMINEFFRRAGWRTWTEPAATRQELLQLARTRWFELIGLTVSCEDNLEQLPDMIMSLRRISQNRAVGVMVGGRIFAERPELALRLGADATAVDGREAVRKAEALVDRLVRRA